MPMTPVAEDNWKGHIYSPDGLCPHGSLSFADFNLYLFAAVNHNHKYNNAQ